MPAAGNTFDSLSALPPNFDSSVHAHRQPDALLMCTADHYDVTWVINDHMKTGMVNRDTALGQWKELKSGYEQTLEKPVNTIQGVEGLNDMVYCANQVLPFSIPETGRTGVILSRMHHQERRNEVPHFRDYFAKQGLEIVEIPDHIPGSFEGMGDAIWHPNRFMLWGGYGHRTDRKVYDFISQELGVPVMVLHLRTSKFYHLDTALCFLDENSAIYIPSAFEPEGIELLQSMIPNLYAITEAEAMNFACNAFCPDRRNVFIHQGSPEVNNWMSSMGFNVHEVDTQQFMYGGGSVFCMKMQYWMPQVRR